PARRSAARPSSSTAMADELLEARGVGRGGRLVLVAEVDPALRAAAQARGEVAEVGVRIGRLAQAHVTERRVALEVVDDGRLARKLDALPGRIAEVEGDLDRRVDRAEQERQQSLVAWLLNLDADRAEPRAELRHALDERADAVEPAERQLRREREPGRGLLAPAPELLLARQAIPRR